MAQTRDKALIYMVRSEGLEPPTPWFEAKYSIQLSYERIGVVNMAGRVRIELTTQRLKVSCSTD